MSARAGHPLHGPAGRWVAPLRLDPAFAGLVTCLLAVGVVLSLAASPGAAARVGDLGALELFQRHLLAAGVALAIMLAVAVAPMRRVYQLCLLVFVGSVIGLTATLLVGPEINGAQRWLHLGPVSLQPSVFAAPSLIALAALAIADGRAPGGPPGLVMAVGALGLVVGLLLAQPDVGLAVVVCSAFALTCLIGGASWRATVLVGAVGAVGLATAALSFPHAAARIQAFLSGETQYQVALAREAFASGGVFGVGPGAGDVKMRLPDAHADYILAVAAEEYGAVFVAGVAMVYAALVVRGLVLADGAQGAGARTAAASLTSLIGLQALVNLAVTLDMAPAKGATAPFVSYGGSSLAAMGLTAGLILAFSRPRADLEPAFNANANGRARGETA